MDPIQFGLILVYNLCIGNITPPVGNTLFVSIKIGNTTLARVMPYMLMYYEMCIRDSGLTESDDSGRRENWRKKLAF